MALAYADDFIGPTLGPHWVGGHHNSSREATIEIKMGLHFSFIDGDEYASVGVITREPVTGDFDAWVEFRVASPAQGTTFELAAMTVAPPARSGLDQDTATEDDRSLVYGVHGVPPYVSSEYDENDGWRIGWNRSTTAPQRDRHGELASDNQFNQYGRDQGAKPTGESTGWLRLQRSGTTWTAYRRDDEDHWSVTGQVHDMNIERPVYLRLAAKHWVKQRKNLKRAPANEVVFTGFELHVPG
jgi:hypothetical protein